MLDSRENYRTELFSAAVQYCDWGWSVIPLRGDSDPNQPKAAAVSWSEFQHRRPSDEELENWFFDRKFEALGIVCGPVSQLAVLDFDDPACARAFARVCPDLVQTVEVQSGNRGLPHYYYHVPVDVPVKSRRTAQADFQAHGTYVVAPPTVISERKWRVVRGVQPRSLSRSDVARINAFLDVYAYQTAGGREYSVPGFDLSEPHHTVVLETALGFRGLPVERLVNYYRRLAARIGRNNALFRAASFARDCGWSRQMALDALVDVHVVQPPISQHVPETPVQRRQEAVKTITSAFGYQPKLRSFLAKIQGVPNTVREKLLQIKQAAVARVLDGLLLAGVSAGVHFTERAACEVLRIFGIGRRAVQAALKALAPSEQPVFERADPPRNPPEKNAHAAAGENKRLKKCSFVRGANRVKKVFAACAGRTPQQFVMPDNARLYRLYGVSPSGSDSLSPEDLRSPEAYRCALQRLLIQRRPGCYSRRWLAQRLGVSVWTCRRYDRQIGLNVRSRFTEQQVTWANLDSLPLDDTPSAPYGAFLETPDLRRYPPVRGLAAHLLARGECVLWRRQLWNYYEIIINGCNPLSQIPHSSVADGETIHKRETQPAATRYAPNSTGAVESEPDRLPVPKPESIFWLCPDCLSFHLQPERPAACSTCGHDHWEIIPAAIWRDVERCKAWWQRLWRERHGQRKHRLAAPAHEPSLTPAASALAEKLYQQVRRRTPERALTRSRAGQLVRDYGAAAVEGALALLEARRRVTSAAGFIITVLRSEYGDRRPNANTAPADDHAAWVERLRQSPYASFYANADHILAV